MGNISSAMFDGAVQFAATFAAAVINHPSMQEVGAGLIVKGINSFMQQEDLAEIVATVNENLKDHNSTAARQMGQDMPVLVREFVGGVKVAMTSKTDKEEKTASEKSTTESETKKKS